jgi:hypothetical protein
MEVEMDAKANRANDVEEQGAATALARLTPTQMKVLQASIRGCSTSRSPMIWASPKRP